MKLVVIVEDEHGIAEVVQMLLESHGYRVAAASNGKAALELIRSENVSAILSDFMMPHMTGGELGAAIRGDPELMNIPFVIMSATSEAVVQQAFNDYDAFVTKPFEIEQLVAVLEKFVEHGRPSRPSMEEVDESMRHLLRGIKLPPPE